MALGDNAWLESPWLWAVAGLVLLLIGVVLGVRGHAGRARARIARHRRLGRRGESRGLRLLRSRGFRVVEEQPSAEMIVQIDGVREGFPIRADALATRGRRRYVVEIKGGMEASKITNRATRRQLLEYAHAFSVDGVLLVDAARGRIHEIQFPVA